MYRSAHYVVFVNYEHFFDGMAEKLKIHAGEDVWFFSGYDCDSLALEPVTGFVREPSVEKRLAALTELAQRGWNVGLRFDPVLYELHYQDLYQRLFEDVFDRVPENRIHSVTLGPFRMPKPYFRNVTRLYPDEALFAGPFESRDKMISYSMDCEQQMMSFCYDQLLRYTAADKIYTCSPSSRQGVTNSQGQSDPIGRGDDRSI
jgi:spore photoproduct lyase